LYNLIGEEQAAIKLFGKLLFVIMGCLTFFNRFVKILPDEAGLVRRAKAGDIAAFAGLYEACVERVYRYVYFFAPNTRAAQVLASQVFFKAWENLGNYRPVSDSFTTWLYSIAWKQVLVPFIASGKNVTPTTNLILSAMGGDLDEDFQIIRVELRALTPEQQQVLALKFIVGLSDGETARIVGRRASDVVNLQMQGLRTFAEYLKEIKPAPNPEGFQRVFEQCLTKLAAGATLEDCLARYPERALQLSPLLEVALLLSGGQNVMPIPTFREYTHDVLIQYAQSRLRRQVVVMPVFQRTALTFATLVAAVLFITGTAHAQSAMPGSVFYGWKRTSEQVWRTVSLDPVETDLVLADRRLQEWITMANDPLHREQSKADYFAALLQLDAANDLVVSQRVLPALQAQKRSLTFAGLSAPDLDTYLAAVVAATPVDLVADVTSPTAVSANTEVSIPTVPVVTAVPTEVVPAVTATEAPPVVTPTDIPTAIVPTETAVAIIPTATDVPVETSVPETENPTAVVSTEEVPVDTEAPTEIRTEDTPVPPEVEPTIEPNFPDEVTPEN
jgi:RNA polymerase sigma-70 factor, ECF subfamily